MAKIKLTYAAPLHRMPIFNDPHAFKLAVKRQSVSLRYLHILKLEFFVNASNEVVCLPYNVNNLHAMAKVLGLNKFLFKTDRYIIPEDRINNLACALNFISQRTFNSIITKNKL